ncbi:MAG: glycine--tRNA ligase subunit beta [Ehrlichia sp.]
MNRHNVSFDNVNVFVTPNRLTIHVSNITVDHSSTKLKVKGPRVTADKISIEGFLKKVDKKLSDLVICKIGNDDFYYAELSSNVKTNIEHVLSYIIENMMHNFPWDKKMRWGTGKTYWVRPIINILCIFDGKVLPVKFADLEANNKSRGNRFTNEEFFEVKDFNSYKSQLKTNNVILCHKERLNFILDQIENLTKKNMIVCEDNTKLLNKLNGILEYPVVILGSVDKKFF